MQRALWFAVPVMAIFTAAQAADERVLVTTRPASCANNQFYEGNRAPLLPARW